MSNITPWDNNPDTTRAFIVTTDRRHWDTDPNRAFHAKLDPTSVPQPLRGFVTRYGLDGPWMACGATSTEAVDACQRELARRVNLALDQAIVDMQRLQDEAQDIEDTILSTRPG